MTHFISTKLDIDSIIYKIQINDGLTEDQGIFESFTPMETTPVT